MMARDERGSMARNAMVAKLKNDYGFSLEESQRAMLMKLAGDLGKVDSSYIAAIHNDQSVLFSFENRSYTVADFASFLSKGRDVTVNAPRLCFDYDWLYGRYGNIRFREGSFGR